MFLYILGWGLSVQCRFICYYVGVYVSLHSALGSWRALYVFLLAVYIMCLSYKGNELVKKLSLCFKSV